MTSAIHELWLVTRSQYLYGPGLLARVAEHSQTIAAALDAPAAIRVRIVFKSVLTTVNEILQLCRTRATTKGASA